MIRVILPRNWAALIAVVATIWCGGASANVWVNEDFSDGVAFDHAAGTSTGGAMDYFADGDGNGVGDANVTNIATVAANGSITNARSFAGSSNAYQLDAGESIVLTPPVDNPGNGPIQYLQVALSADNLPAAGNDVAELRWRFTLNDVPYDYIFRLTANGSGGMDIIAGQEYNSTNTLTIDTLPNTLDWRLLTIQVVKNSSGTFSDPRTGQSGLGRQVNFFSSSDTAGLNLTPGGADGLGDGSGVWSVTALAGTVYVGTVYWEGGITTDGGFVPDNTANGPLRTLSLLPVELSAFGID